MTLRVSLFITAADPNAARAHLLADAKRLGLSLSFKALASAIYPLDETAHGTR